MSTSGTRWRVPSSSRATFRVVSALSLALALISFLAAPAPAEGLAPVVTPPVVGETTKHADIIPGELVVRFREGVSIEDKQSALVTAGATTTIVARGLDAALAKVDPAEALRIQKELEGDPRVLYAEPNYRVHLAADQRRPSDPEYPQQWWLDNTGQLVGTTPGTPDADIDAPEAWLVTTGSAEVVVAVIDTGIDFSHPDLGGSHQHSPRMWINPGEDCPGCRFDGVDNDGNGYIDDWRGWDFVNDDNNPFDDNGHGTHVAGIIGATGNNGVGGSGVAWNVTLAALKFLDFAGGGSTFDAAEAILYAAAMGFPIANNSWGSGVPAQVLVDAITIAHQADMLFVAAAGNDGFSNDDVGTYPASYPIPNVISVAASDANDMLATFSNYGGRSVDIAAPGKDVYSTWTGVPGHPWSVLSGTSMATPMVSGAAALLLARFPEADPVALKALLMNSVDKTPDMTDKIISGGRLNVNNALRCAGQPVLVVESPFAGFAVEGGTPVTVVALAGNCASNDGVIVSASVNGVPIEVTALGDGTYTATFTPETTGPIALAVSADVRGRRTTTTVRGAVVDNYDIRNVPYEWIEPRATGGFQILMWGDDESRVLDLPFPFTYYGVDYTQLTVSTNGYVVFGDSPALSFVNVALPNQMRPNGVVAPFWDDLNPSMGGSIWWDVEGDAPNRRFVVAWEEVPHYNDIGSAYFEVIFDEATDAITFQYQDVVFEDPTLDYGASASIGIEHPAGTVGRSFSNNRAALRDYEQHWGIQFRQVPAGAPRITDFALPQATVGADYSHVLGYEGGVAPVTWSISSGELPPGLTLDPETGEISGTPSVAGTWEIEFRVTDSSVPAQVAEQLLELEVVIGYTLEEVPFSWIEAREGGTDIGFTLDDTSTTIDLPFIFGFYGEKFTRLTVSTNGYVVFGEADARSFSNQNIPNPAPPNGYAAPFWDDLSPQAGGGVWYRTIGEAPSRAFVVAWYETPRYNMHGAATFEIVLYEGTNTIEFHYVDTSFEFSVYDHGDAATIGLESPTGTSGMLFSYDEPALAGYDGVTGLRFEPLSAGPLPPFISSIPPTAAVTGIEYVYQPSATGATPLAWTLLAGPDGMTIDPASGALHWVPGAPGEYPVSIQVTDANGSDIQEFTVFVTATERHEVTWSVLDGWQSPPGTLLSAAGTLASVQMSDDIRLEIGAGGWTSFAFDGVAPEGAVIESLTVVVEYHQSAGMPIDAVTWEIGGGTLEEPIPLGAIIAEQVLSAANEKAVGWEVREWISTPDLTRGMTFVVRNGAASGSVVIDQVRVELVYSLP